METSHWAIIGGIITAVISVFGAYSAVRTFRIEIKEDVESQFAHKFQELRKDLDAFKEATAKDLENTKEIFNGELSHLSEKIENLRSEIRVQHTQTMQQQSQLVDLLKDILKNG